ncbi:MAG TPA: LysE family transporter [Kofleriaceae bacterium]
MNALDVTGAAALGVVLGVVTGMPIGVVNVAIVEAATRGERRYASHIGIGGALADTVHASIAFVGVGRVVTDYPQYTRAMAIVAAALVVGYALLALRRHRIVAPRHRRYGVVTGLVLTLPNPAALAAWIAVAAVVWPTIDLVAALAVGIGVGVGSALWFVLLARFAAALPPEHRIVRWLPRIAIVLLIAIAVLGVVRAFG